MVVIIEDVTDAQHTTNEEQPAPSTSLDNEAEEWVKVEAEDAGPAGCTGATSDVPETGSSIPEMNEAQPTPDSEEFKEQLGHAELLKSEGNKHFATSDFDTAIDLYNKALKIVPHSATSQKAVYYSNRAACYMRQEEYSLALIDCTAALDLNPSYVKALLRRATAYEALEDFEKALLDVQKVVQELDPSNQGAAEILARVEPKAMAKREEMKEEMIGKLKELGNTVLGKFGLSLDNFKAEKDPSSGSYSIKFQQ